VQLQSDPSRSIFVQQLLARALQNNGRPSRSVAESADIASAPIIAALLARQDQKSQAAQQANNKAMANQLVGGSMQTKIPLENLDGQPPDVYSVPTEGPTGAMRSALAGVLAQSPQAMASMAMQQAMPQQQKPEAYTLSPGQVRYQGSQAIAGVPAAPDKDTTDAQNYALAVKGGYKGSFVEYQEQIRRAGASNINTEPLVPTVDPKTGKGVLTPRSQAAGAEPYSAPKPPNEVAQKNLGLVTSMSEAGSRINGYEKAGTIDSSDMKNAALASNPVTHTLTSEGYRQYESAAKQWITNYVFLKSGSNTNPQEISDAWKTFFPQPGDSAEVKKTKAKARTAEEGIWRDKFGSSDSGSSGQSVLTYDPATGTFK
jgi:hypothetical protein